MGSVLQDTDGEAARGNNGGNNVGVASRRWLARSPRKCLKQQPPALAFAGRCRLRSRRSGVRIPPGCQTICVSQVLPCELCGTQTPRRIPLTLEYWMVQESSRGGRPARRGHASPTRRMIPPGPGNDRDRPHQRSCSEVVGKNAGSFGGTRTDSDGRRRTRRGRKCGKRQTLRDDGRLARNSADTHRAR